MAAIYIRVNCRGGVYPRQLCAQVQQPNRAGINPAPTVYSRFLPETGNKKILKIL